MNSEMKKILSNFLFVNVLIACIGIIIVGSTVASERSSKNIYGEAYTVMKIVTEREQTTVSVGEKEYTVSTALIKKIKEYKDYIMMTPLGAIYYLSESIGEFLK